MTKLYHLSTCDTCKRILKQLNLEGVKLIDVKKQIITETDLDFAANKLGGYEVLFNKRAQKYRQRGLNNKTLTEQDFKDLILEEYTFMKRPLLITKNEVVGGNSKKSVEQMALLLNQ